MTLYEAITHLYPVCKALVTICNDESYDYGFTKEVDYAQECIDSIDKQMHDIFESQRTDINWGEVISKIRRID